MQIHSQAKHHQHGEPLSKEEYEGNKSKIAEYSEKKKKEFELHSEGVREEWKMLSVKIATRIEDKLVANTANLHWNLAEIQEKVGYSAEEMEKEMEAAFERVRDVDVIGVCSGRDIAHV